MEESKIKSPAAPKTAVNAAAKADDTSAAAGTKTPANRNLNAAGAAKTNVTTNVKASDATTATTMTTAIDAANADAKTTTAAISADVKATDTKAVNAKADNAADTTADDTTKTDAKASNAEYDEVEVEEVVETEEEVETIDEKTGKKMLKKVPVRKIVKVLKKVRRTTPKPVEPREPDSVFIDHGAVLPEFIPGTHLFALIRDPGTLYVYWNSDVESRNGWRLSAYDGQGNVLQSFTTSHLRGGRGYFHIPTILAARVTLEKVESDGSVGMTLESTIRIAQQSRHAQAEKWVDVHDQRTIYEAPSSGHAPNYDAEKARHDLVNDAVAGGGRDAMLLAVPDGLRPGMNPSSWFGPLRAPGSSDILAASSDRLIRR